MARVVTTDILINFGDCDPAGIVFFPNFSRWMDAASLNFFVACGIPVWSELVKTTGITGTPVLEINVKYSNAARYGERLVIATSVEEWRAKVFVQRHVVTRGETLICEGREVRAFVIRHPDDPDRIKAIRVPDDIRAKCA
jgi:4-hydroxybenzoyl-CoA thioesterase